MIPRQRPPFFGWRRIRWRSLRLRDAIGLTLPVWLALGFIWGGACVRFLETAAFDDWWSHQGRLPRMVQARIDTLAALPEAMALRLHLDAESPDPAVLSLLVDRGDWARWHSAPLALDDVWLDAEIVHGNAFVPAEIRKRGDTSVHWLTPKKSMTLETGRGELYKGYRRLSVSAKTPLEQVATDAMAQDYGLLAADTLLAPVFVNNRFYGIFRLSEDVDESFLRAHGRLPGNIFRGDTAERGEAFPGRPRGLFQNLAIWDRVAGNDRPTAPAGALARLLRAVQGLSFADHERLMGMLDPEEWQRLIAYLLVTGDPYHMTNVHNQYWYEDPASGVLHPIPGDIRLRDLTEPPALDMNDAFRAVLRDPRVWDGALAILHRRMQEDAALGRTAERLVEAEARFGDALRFDRLRAGEIPPVARAEAIRAGLEANLDVLRTWIRDGKAEALVGTPRDGVAVVDVRTTGRAAVALVALEVGEGRTPKLWADRDRDGRLGPSDPEISLADADGAPDAARRLALAPPLRLLAGLDTSASTFEPEPMPYRLFVEAGPGLAPVRDLVLRNAYTDAEVEPEALARGTPLAEGATWHPWRFHDPEPRTRRLAGEVRLDADLRIGAHETLVIASGTTLRLAPGVSILSRGRVLAEGTEAAPIRIGALRARDPWGALALQGPASSGSRFAHVEITGGSCATLDGVEYKGMVDVHHARDVRFENVRFASNLRCDDALNAVHAEVDLLGCRFEDVNADAADYDLSTGRVCGSVFANAGNDALDLMGSTPWIEGNVMLGSGDKGVSVGEDSSPVIVANRIASCALGVEVKDASRPWLVANVLRDNGIGVHQKRKNWRYGEGGFARWVGPALDDHEADGDSRLSTAGAHSLEEAGWALVAPRARIAFEDDFDPPQDGFAVTEGRGRIERRRGDLVLVPRGRDLAVERELDWDLTAVGAPSRVVVEVAATSIDDLHLELETDAGDLFRARLPRTADADHYALSVLEPPSAHYRRLRILASPVEEAARVRIHEIRWVVPSDDPQRSCPRVDAGAG